MTQPTQPSRSAPATDVRVEVTVQAPIDRAFAVFTERFDTWWPQTHHIGQGDMVAAVIEPRLGGRWYERSADGAECDWGTVLAWDPPTHLALSWALGPDWQPVADPRRASRVDVRFAAEADGRTTVTLVHSALDAHGQGWESLREAVGSPNGWSTVLDAYARSATASARS